MLVIINTFIISIDILFYYYYNDKCKPKWNKKVRYFQNF